MESGPHAAEAAAAACAQAEPAAGPAGGTALGGPDGRHTAAASAAAGSGGGGGALKGRSPPRCTTLFAWRHAVSPHLAVRLEGGAGRAVTDDELIASTAVHVRRATEELLQRSERASRGSLLLLETAGGVTSPAPSGRLACDALRPLRLPCVLVGDPRLGGIAATLSAYDSLTARGWDVEAVVLVGSAEAEQVTPAATPPAAHGSGHAGSSSSSGDGGAPVGPRPVAGTVPLDNLTFLREHLTSAAAGVHRLGAPPPEVVGVPACLPPPLGHSTFRDGLDPNLSSWLAASLPAFSSLLETLQRRHAARLAGLAASAAAAEAQLWWPFTQHAGLTHGSATVVDARCGETWTALAPPQTPPPAATPATGSNPASALKPDLDPALVPLYDASCSWWTQAATPELQTELARAVSYAAGRYMHVLFPEIAHAPALAAADALLRGPGAGWAERVFFSDDGSTAIEVALKMAFRKFLADRGELSAAQAAGTAPPGADSASGGAAPGGELLVLGLQGGYHGDTLGSQDCVAPSVFNGPLQAPWYRGRGLFLEPPYVGMRQGRWQILDPPAWLRRHHPGELPSWASLDDLLGGDDAPGLAAAYRAHVAAAMDEFGRGQAGSGGGRLAACILEPLLQGAGGMLLVEPAFQRAVAEVCRSRGLPVIVDEVFTGLFRAGHLSAAAALRIMPDIACYAKLLTGGLVPMAATLATGDVFRAFNGPSKLFALLHGHSYTAYPIGAAAAAASMEVLTRPETNPNLCHPCRCPKTPACAAPCGRLLPLWDEQVVLELSSHPLVSRVVAIGTVLALELGGTTSGYGSYGSMEVVQKLRDEHGIYARPLGSVVYLMVPPTARRETAAWLAGSLRRVLDESADATDRSPGAAADPVVV
ncbi:hypothetical protein GPECTOR_10g990 [Gonium pectorale]|uniref:Adenosylmethionine-8-amino-7-oxononanoate aminotransferase n=1 Tax=Gonium pectorale TaxID=33097 RepID=A0A150GR58_GONPE|nr:hypothetical protein GPECTOR_10g990 [Gonium pectorale]|eukprot:KXZ52356.1 hypothetical protein GPECTOR_10g990 [Gonium pectorale]